MLLSSISSVIEISAEVRDSVVAHALAELPNEACGLLSGFDGMLLDIFHRVANAAESPTRFELDPQQMLDAERTAHETGRSVTAVMHSHVDTSPYPSQTDVEDSGRYDPAGTYSHLIVSLRHAEPTIRGYRIRDGVIHEELVAVVEPESTINDQASAVAAVAALPKRPKPSEK